MKHLIAILAFIFIGCNDCADPTCTNPLVDYEANVLISDVVDGDTYRFEVSGEEFDIRLLGVDCFETRRGTRLSDQAAAAGISEDSALALGDRAELFADSVLWNETVTILRDSVEDNMDVYGRLLRHVVVGGEQMSELLFQEKLTVPE